MEYILETKNITKKYNNSKVLNNLNMHTPKGSIYGLIGKNGAGKTTLIRIITDLQKETSGTYILYGISNLEKEIINKRKKVGAIIESPALYLNMTAKENLIEHGQIYQITNLKDNCTKLWLYSLILIIIVNFYGIFIIKNKEIN